VLADGLVLVPYPTQSRNLVLKDVGSHQQAPLDGQALQRVLHQGEKFIPIPRKLDLLAGLLVLGSAFGRLSLV
jgi:hypothetical protein